MEIKIVCLCFSSLPLLPSPFVCVLFCCWFFFFVLFCLFFLTEDALIPFCKLLSLFSRTSKYFLIIWRPSKNVKIMHVYLIGVFAVDIFCWYSLLNTVVTEWRRDVSVGSYCWSVRQSLEFIAETRILAEMTIENLGNIYLPWKKIW